MTPGAFRLSAGMSPAGSLPLSTVSWVEASCHSDVSESSSVSWRLAGLDAVDGVTDWLCAVGNQRFRRYGSWFRGGSKVDVAHGLRERGRGSLDVLGIKLLGQTLLFLAAVLYCVEVRRSSCTARGSPWDGVEAGRLGPGGVLRLVKLVPKTERRPISSGLEKFSDGSKWSLRRSGGR